MPTNNLLKDTQAEPEAERSVVIRRSYDVPARYLFEAWSKPEHVTKWFGPVGWPLTTCEMDFRVGGTFRFQMTGPGGETNTPFGGAYLEIVPNRRIVFDNGFLTPNAGRMVVTITFAESAGRTEMTHRTVFESVAMKQAHVGAGFVEGTNSGLDQLGDVVRALAQKPS